MTEDEALTRAAVERGLDLAWLPELRSMLRTDRAAWRACCGGLCTPCVLDLGRAVERARALLAVEG